MPTHSPSRVLCLGPATYDTIAVVGSMRGADSGVDARNLVTADGGAAATAAEAVAHQGVTVDFVGVVNGHEGRKVFLTGLQIQGVGTPHAERLRGAATAQRVANVSALTAPRRMLSRRAPVSVAELPTGSNWFQVDLTGYPTLLSLGVPAGTWMGLDDGNGVADLSLGLVDLHVPTVEVLGARFAVNNGLANAADPDDLVAGVVRATSAAGAGRLVATDGARFGVLRRPRCCEHGRSHAFLEQFGSRRYLPLSAVRCHMSGLRPSTTRRSAHASPRVSRTDAAAPRSARRSRQLSRRTVSVMQSTVRV